MRGVQSCVVGLIFILGGVSRTLVPMESNQGGKLIFLGVCLLFFGGYLLWVNRTS